LRNAEKRIETLKSKGVPDSALSRAKVFLYQTREAKKRGDIQTARLSADSMQVLIARAEDLYTQHISKLRPVVDSLLGVINTVRKDMSGLQARKIDSSKAIIDSFIQIDWLLQAEQQAQELIGYIPKLEFQEERAQELKDRVPGTWVCTDVKKSEANPAIHFVEKKVFNFGGDKDVKLVETGKGRKALNLKLDYEFVSYGTYGLAGDTIFLFIDRFVANRQNVQEYLEEDGKRKWKATKHPTYDSTITDRSQDRFITFSDLKMDFNKR
jgi:hypothetical protein